MLRTEKIAFLHRFFDAKSTPGLEIGPHVEPLFRKSQGFAVQYVETRSTEKLREAVVLKGGDGSKVEEIDFVLDRAVSLPDLVGGEERYAWMASSHVMEHIPDLVGHLQEAGRVLRAGGKYAVIFPDRNFCFDCLRPASTLGQVLQAHIEKRKVAPIAAQIDEWRYGARPQGVKLGGWTDKHAGATLAAKYPGWPARLKELIAAGRSLAPGWFGHQWVFDPVAFGELICDLIEVGVCPFEIEAIEPTRNMDFICILRKAAEPGLAASRDVAARVKNSYRVPSYNIATAVGGAAADAAPGRELRPTG